MLKFGSSEPNMVSPGTAGMNMFSCGAISKKESISLLNIPLDFSNRGHHGADSQHGTIRVPSA